MKKLPFILLFVPFFSFGQWIPLGNDLDGEAVNDQSGWAVDLNADGTVVAVGAPFNDDNGNVAGQVRVYENQSGNWVQVGSDIDGSATLDRSGYSVSISNDGTIVAIGAPDKTSNGFESGQVRVFENLSGNWTQIGDEIIGEAFSDHSGLSVDISGDGTTVAIGAPDNEGTMGGNFGHVRVYRNQSGTWTQIGGDIDGEAAEDNSGYDVAISEDGTVVAIGAPFNDGTDTDAGHARVYQNQGGSWVQLGDDIDGEAANDRFGWSVALSADGTIVAIAGYDNNSTGHVRVFQNDSGVWTQIGEDIDGESLNERFGFSIDLNANGTVVAVGAPLSDAGGLEKGRVNIYQHQSNNWVQIDDGIQGEAFNDRSGFSVSLSADGSIAAIGAHLNDGNGDNSGHARIYQNTHILRLDGREQRAHFVAYPNPSSGVVTLNLGRSYPAIGIRIYDSSGRDVLSRNDINTNSILINTEEFATGVYSMEVSESNDRKTIIKIIKE